MPACRHEPSRSQSYGLAADYRSRRGTRVYLLAGISKHVLPVPLITASSELVHYLGFCVVHSGTIITSLVLQVLLLH